jgi:hypothetical protein
MVAAFEFMERRRPDAPRSRAVPGDRLFWQEHGEYILTFSSPPSPRELELLTDLGYEPITGASGILALGNFVGRLRVQGVEIGIPSSKLGPEGMSGLLEAAVGLAANLIYGWSAPTGFPAHGQAAARRPVPYHQLQYLKHVMLDERVGQRLQDAFAVVEERPTQRFVAGYPVVPITQARAIDAKTVRDMHRHPERLTEVTSDHPWHSHPLALRPAAHGAGDERLFPRAVSVPRGHLVYDTPENRFLRHFVTLCLMVVGRFVDHPALHRSLRRNCRTMLATLESMASARFLEDVADVYGLVAPTQALAKLPGYRELLQIYRDLVVQPALPPAQEEATRFLEGKDVALLYEYWVFLKIVEAASRERPPGRPKIATKGSDLGVLIPRGLEVAIGDDTRITYNGRFGHDPERGSYSTPFRPDVTLRVGPRCHVFDAKYRLDRPPFSEEEDLDTKERETFSFNRGDLYKMHSYRDALRPVDCAWIVYPGHEFCFFDIEHGRRVDSAAADDFRGVGAVPLRPAASTTHLEALVARLLHADDHAPLR